MKMILWACNTCSEDNNRLSLSIESAKESPRTEFFFSQTNQHPPSQTVQVCFETMTSNALLLLPQKLKKENQSWWLAGMNHKSWKQIIGEANLVTSNAPSDCRWCILLDFHSYAALKICSSYKNAHAHQKIFYLTVNSINLEWPEITRRDHAGPRTTCWLEDETKRSVYAPSAYTQPGRYNLSYLFRMLLWS